MERLWFITNPASGSTSAATCDALEAVFEDRGLALAGRTRFPDEPLPEGAVLDAKGVDTVVLFAGDGTINAALCALADWDGAFLILPGGTMNMLAKLLHDSLDPAAIIHAAHGGDRRRVAVPFVEAGAHRAFVGLILGPAAHWGRAREQARRHQLRNMLAAMRAAWRRTFSRGVRVSGAPGLRGRYQAVFVQPEDDGLEVVGIDAREWGAIVDLGWSWLTGDWIAARAVSHTRTASVRIEGRRPAMALFDGEPVLLPPAAVISGGRTREMFLTTKGRI